MNRAKIEEKLKVAEKEYSSVMFLSDSKSFMKMKIAQAKIQLLTSLLAEDGGEVIGIIGDTTKHDTLRKAIAIRDAVVQIENIMMYRGEMPEEGKLREILLKLQASQHTKGDGV